MKKTVLLMFCIFFQFIAFSQNPGWIFPPLYKADILGSLPPIPLPTVPTNVEGYHGQTATAASNMQLDASGNLLFFFCSGWKIFSIFRFKQ